MRLKRLSGPILAALLSGCVATGPEIRVVDLGCDWARPIRVSQSDSFTEETARAILTHNLVLQERCRVD